MTPYHARERWLVYATPLVLLVLLAALAVYALERFLPGLHALLRAL